MNLRVLSFSLISTLCVSSVVALSQSRQDPPAFRFREIPAQVTFWTNPTNGQSMLVLWSTDIQPRKLIEFQMNWQRAARGVFSFDGSLATTGRLQFHAYGNRDQARVINIVHFHEVLVSALSPLGKMQPHLRVSGQAAVLHNHLDPRTPTLTHFEPTNARIDITFPLQKRGALLVGGEVGPWIDGLGSQFAITPGARATIRLRF